MSDMRPSDTYTDRRGYTDAEIERAAQSAIVHSAVHWAEKVPYCDPHTAQSRYAATIGGAAQAEATALGEPPAARSRTLDRINTAIRAREFSHRLDTHTRIGAFLDSEAIK